MLTEPPRNTPKLFCRLRYVSAADIVSMFHNELFHFILKGGSLVRGQRNFALSLSRPYQRPIESF